MSTQQDICAAGSESRPPMLNKENYVPWSSHLLRYAKSRPNGNLIHNSILNGPYVRNMIPEPGDANRDISNILMGLPEDIYAAVDSCETAQEIWLRVQQMMKGSDIRIQEKKAKLFNEWKRFTSNEKESIESYYHRFLKLMNDLKRNKYFPEKIATGSESRPPMLNKENYVPWSSRLLRYAKSRPNGKLIHNSILNGPYVRKMIPEPGDANRDITVTETFHLQTDEADDQAIQTILLGLPKDIYAAVDSCETAQEIWLRVQQMMKGSDIGIQEKKAKLFNEWERNKHFPEKIASNLKFLNNLQPEWSRHKEVDELKDERLANTQDPLALMANSNNPYAFQQLIKINHHSIRNYMQQPMPNPEDIKDPTTAMNMALALMAKAFKLNYSTPTNNNQRILSNPRNRQIAQPGNPAWYNDVIGNQNQIGNGNLMAVRTEGNAAGQNGNQIRCYNCRGVGHYARNCTVRPMRRDAA
nr:hypothetical protein [Tanacetum cinerariifolium]